MNSFNLVVYNNSALYSIIEELKNIFAFKISTHITDQNNLVKFLDQNPQTIIISSQKIEHKFINLIISKPIKIKALIEKINIIMSKSNFKIQSSLILKNYYVDINSRFLIKDDKKIKLTQKEVEIIIYLKNSDIEKTPQILQKDIWKHSPEVETHTVETHIYRLRKKIEKKFKDNEFISSLKGGYKINV